MDAKRVVATMFREIRAWIEPAFQDHEKRLSTLEARPRAELDAETKAHIAATVASLHAGQGDGVTPAQLRGWMEELIAARMASLPAPRDGRDADMSAVLAHVDEAVAARFAALPVPRDGKDVDERALLDRIESAVDMRFAALPVPKDGAPGKDAEPIHPDTIARMVEETGRRLFAELPKPRDGKDVDLAWLDALVQAKVTTATASIPRGADGAPGRDGIDGKDGAPGADGAPGRDGDPIHPDTLRLMVMQYAREIIAEMPKPHDGKSVDMQTLTDLIGAKVTLSMAELPKPEPGAPGKDADMAEVARLIDAATSDLRASIPAPIDSDAVVAPEDFIDMADEILRGLEQDDDIEAEAASMQHLFQGSGGAGNAEISAQLADVKRTLMMPVLPVLDERGNFIGARRVDPDAQP